MSGQIDIDWSSPPFGVEALQQGRIRIVVRESDVPAFRNQTVRLMIANTATAESRLDRLSGLDDAMADAVSLKFMPAPLTRQQQDELFRYYVRSAQ